MISMGDFRWVEIKWCSRCDAGARITKLTVPKCLNIKVRTICHFLVDESVNFWVTHFMDPILKAQEEIDKAKAQLHAAVRQARAAGRTWADIGEVLRISRQAAFKRFGEVINPADGQRLTGVPMAIAVIQQLTEKVFDLIAQARYEELEQLMHPDARKELPASLIWETWASILAEVGAKESYGDTHVVLPGGERIDDDTTMRGIVVGVTTIQHEAGETMGRVAVDEQQRVVGILIVAPDHEPLPF